MTSDPVILEAIEVVKRMQERLARPQDWRQRMEGPRSGPNCLLGALSWCSEGQWKAGEAAKEALKDVVQATQGDDWLGGRSLLVFNDDKDTTHDLVLTVLDCTLDALESELAS